jgi:hypothetical protein
MDGDHGAYTRALPATHSFLAGPIEHNGRSRKCCGSNFYKKAKVRVLQKTGVTGVGLNFPKRRGWEYFGIILKGVLGVSVRRTHLVEQARF